MSRSVSSSAFDYESLPAGYYDQVFKKGEGIQSKWHQMKFDKFRSEILDGSQHLDIGCGPGIFIGTLSENITSVGVDISETQLNYARTHYETENHSFVNLKAEPETLLPFENNRFDVITLIEIIEHLPLLTIGHLLREAHRVLQPGGRILISTPNYASLWVPLEYLLNRFSEVSYKDQHITHFNCSRLSDLIQTSGFIQSSVKAYQGLSPFSAILNWEFPEKIQRWEPDFILDSQGFLLFGAGVKAEVQNKET